jgi:hypothetical protein
MMESEPLEEYNTIDDAMRAPSKEWQLHQLQLHTSSGLLHTLLNSQ